MKNPLRPLLCRLNFHKHLLVIQSFGAAQHIGCPHCRRQYAIHHGMQQVVPWTPDFASLYTDMGYDIAAGVRRWQARIERHSAA